MVVCSAGFGCVGGGGVGGGGGGDGGGDGGGSDGGGGGDGGIGGSFSLMYLAKLLCETKLNLDAVKYYGQMSLIVLCVHLIDLNTCAISGKIYENLIQTTGDQIIAVSM